MKKFPFILIVAAVMAAVYMKLFRPARQDISPASINSPAVTSGRLFIQLQKLHDTTQTKNNLKPKFTSMVDVKYHLRLYDGTPIDSSYLSTSPADSIFRCRLNSGVIEGWAVAIPKMHIGDSCRVLIPYNLGYGTTASGDIKPFSTLQFDIKLKGIPAYEQ